MTNDKSIHVQKPNGELDGRISLGGKTPSLPAPMISSVRDEVVSSQEIDAPYINALKKFRVTRITHAVQETDIMASSLEVAIDLSRGKHPSVWRDTEDSAVSQAAVELPKETKKPLVEERVRYVVIGTSRETRLVAAKRFKNPCLYQERIFDEESQEYFTSNRVGECAKCKDSDSVVDNNHGFGECHVACTECGVHGSVTAMVCDDPNYICYLCQQDKRAEGTA